MSKITLQQLGPLLKTQRGGRGIREAAQEIGISAATLSRVESGKQPDLETFSKLCQWLNIDAGEVLGCGSGTTVTTASPSAIAYSVHYRAGKTMKPETAQHLGELILAVQCALENELAGPMNNR